MSFYIPTSASDYDPAVDRGEVPQIFSPPAAPPIDTWLTAGPGLADPSAAPVSGGQPDQSNMLNQVMSGTYAGSVLRSQLANQGRFGVFVNPDYPYESLLNPNATSLAEATLLASHAPNFALWEAAEMQLAVSLTPFVGAVSTWMHPASGPLAKGIAVLGALADVAALGTALGSVAEVGSDTARQAGTTVKYLRESPIKGNPRLPWVVHQIRATGSKTESVFLITENGVVRHIEADAGVTRFLVEAKAAGFEGRVIRDFGKQLFGQLRNYFTVADALPYKGIRYAAGSESGAANLYKAFSTEFSEALSSGFLQIWWIEDGAAFRYLPH